MYRLSDGLGINSTNACLEILSLATKHVHSQSPFIYNNELRFTKMASTDHKWQPRSCQGDSCVYEKL
jgi:hypothetical protein